MPNSVEPEAFGMHANCSITTAQAESGTLLEGMLIVSSSGGSSSSGKSKEDVMDETAANLLDKTPKVFDMEYVEKQYPTLYNESMNTVLKQECGRYNKLLLEMPKSLTMFRKALKGQVQMTKELETLGDEMYKNQVPGMYAPNV